MVACAFRGLLATIEIRRPWAPLHLLGILALPPCLVWPLGWHWVQCCGYRQHDMVPSLLVSTTAVASFTPTSTFTDTATPSAALASYYNCFAITTTTTTQYDDNHDRQLPTSTTPSSTGLIENFSPTPSPHLPTPTDDYQRASCLPWFSCANVYATCYSWGILPSLDVDLVQSQLMRQHQGDDGYRLNFRVSLLLQVCRKTTEKIEQEFIDTSSK